MANKKILHVDMDGVVADYWNAEYNKLFKDYKEKGFFRGLPEMEGMRDALTKLEQKYDIFFLTTAPWSSPRAWKEKREWVEDKFGDQFKKKIIMTHRKDMIYGDYLIDDRTANGASQFKGEHLHFGTSKFPDWASVVKYLL